MCAMALCLLVAGTVPIQGCVSPDGRLAVVLDADRDSGPGPPAEEGPNGDLLVVDRHSSAIRARVPWPGDITDGAGLLRDRTQCRWRADSGAVAINTADTHYASTLV